MIRLITVYIRWRDRVSARWPADDAGIEILQAVILAAGLGLAAVAITGFMTNSINGWLAKIPL
jgi:hypothetical protein